MNVLFSPYHLDNALSGSISFILSVFSSPHHLDITFLGSISFLFSVFLGSISFLRVCFVALIHRIVRFQTLSRSFRVCFLAITF